MKKYYISKSTIHGKGVFAARDIKKGEVVFIAKGKPTEWEVKDKQSSSTGPNWIGLKHNLWLDPFETNALTFLNHSCDPNLGVKGSVSFTALKNIRKGKELDFDYSITEEDKLWTLPFTCACGAKNCRKKVKSIQFLPSTTFKRYLPYVPTYFRRLYTREHKL